MIHVESFEATDPPIFMCFEARGGVIFLSKVSSLQDVGNFGFLCLMGILTELRYFFLYLEVAYPPHSEVF